MPNDLFGNPIVYAKKTNGEEYNIPDDIHQRSSGVNNGEYDSGRIIIGRLNVDLVQVEPKTFALNDYRDGRIEITTSAKYNPSLLTPNFNDRINRGYTQSPQDWRNTEAAVEFKIVSGDPTGYIEFWFRTGKDIAGCACEGFAYKAGWRVDGNQQKCTKQMYKGQQYFTTRSRTLGSLIGKWCKLRAACVDLDIDGNVTNDRTKAVKCVIQSWMQVEGSDTTYYTQDRIDDGFWGLNGETCQGSQTQVGNWGGPIVALTFNGISGAHFKSLNVREVDPTIDFPIQPPPTQNPPPVDPPPVEPPPTPPVTGSLDANGIQWLVATGAQDVVPQSRFNSGDYRWSDNRTNVSQFGYEVTAIVTFDGVASGGHMALKHWGPNHSGSCGHTEDGDCCCWYDIGLRANGDVQLQTERPHPSNHDFTLTLNASTGPLYMASIGKVLDGNKIGLKWNIFPVVDGGNADDGSGIHIRMWVDKDALNAQGKPNNNWEKVVDFIDTGQVLGDYIAPSEHDIEMRISDTDEAITYAGGLHFRRMILNDKSGTTTPPLTCPPGQHLENGVCVLDTTVPPPTQTDPLGVTSSGGFVHDKYGVRMIYRSDTNKTSNYFAPLPSALLSDLRFDARFTSQSPGSGSGGGGGGSSGGSNTLIWDSNVDGGWNNATPRTVTDEEGNQTANGKGIYMAASGDPRLIIDGAGVGTLEADPGHGRFYVRACNFNAMLEGELKFDDSDSQNTSFKLRSRHQMDGNCEERFGGLGGSISRTQCAFQVEPCHNTHLDSHNFDLPTEIEVNEWIKFRFIAKNTPDNTEILHEMYIDYNDSNGYILVATYTLPASEIEDYFMDRASFMAESEIWMRINNEDNESSISYRNVKLWELSDTVTTLPPVTTPPTTLPINSDGTYRVPATEAFLTVYPDAASKQEDLTNNTRVARYSYNYNTLHQRKTWDDLPTDFRNVESKLYFRALEPNAPSPQDFAIVIGSVNHESEYQNGCGGSSYHGCIDVLTGKFFFVKEQYHGSEIATQLSTNGIGNIFNKLIGFCFVVAHFDTEDRTHLEIWTDVNATNTWTKQFQFDDTNNWGTEMTHCNALIPGARVSWGSPKVLFEPPEQNVDIKYLSVREIQPGQLLTSTTTGGGGGGGSGSVSRIFNHWDFLYNTLVDVSGFVCTGQDIAPGIPYELVYNVTTATNDMELSGNWNDEDNRIRAALQVNSLSSQMINVLPRKMGVWLKKVGLPTGTIHLQMWDAPSDIKILGNVKVTYGTLDVATLTTEYPDSSNPYIFTNDLATVLIPNGMQYKWKIGVYFESTFSDDENYVAIAVNYNNPFDSTNTDLVEWSKHTDGYMRWNTYTGRDICAQIWF